MNATPEDLHGVTVGPFIVTERAHIAKRRGVCWWLMCATCKHRCWRKASSIRQSLRDGKAPTCLGCAG